LFKNLITKGIFFIGIFAIPVAYSATYTHRLQYTNTDNDETAVLFADIVFDDSDASAQQNTSGSSTAIDTGFTTSITFSYTPTPGGTTYTISGSEITEYRLTRKAGTTDYDGDPTLLSQLDNIQFGTFGATGNAFSLTMNATSFKLQANESGEDNDFLLSSTVQFPAPLPLLGIIPAFSYIRRLKKRFNSIVSR
tara:strand:- start:3095 stop:3676 length:582 start_codon:yes stop_codon:yes gene_type:complete